jgi:tellurite resistance protein TehA-like permease
VAAPAVACAAYVQLFSYDGIAKSLFYIALAFLAFMTSLIVSSYFGRNRFDMSYWAYVFPVEAFCVAAMTSYQASKV